MRKRYDCTFTIVKNEKAGTKIARVSGRKITRLWTNLFRKSRSTRKFSTFSHSDTMKSYRAPQRWKAHKVKRRLWKCSNSVGDRKLFFNTTCVYATTNIWKSAFFRFCVGKNPGSAVHRNEKTCLENARSTTFSKTIPPERPLLYPAVRRSGVWRITRATALKTDSLLSARRTQCEIVCHYLASGARPGCTVGKNRCCRLAIGPKRSIATDHVRRAELRESPPPALPTSRAG